MVFGLRLAAPFFTNLPVTALRTRLPGAFFRVGMRCLLIVRFYKRFAVATLYGTGASSNGRLLSLVKVLPPPVLLLVALSPTRKSISVHIFKVAMKIGTTREAVY